ncbi:hypothetical protein A2U01_0107108, partial [Trifolium medium]|nr:hypothetical protein [Trifolium medium]
ALVEVGDRWSIWVMDFGCSYHVCLKKEYFETLELVEGGVVNLEEGKT